MSEALNLNTTRMLTLETIFLKKVAITSVAQSIN
jgi:hypothetical protein